jgi:hypothetical protein
MTEEPKSEQILDARLDEPLEMTFTLNMRFPTPVSSMLA